MCIGLNPSTADQIRPDATITHLTLMLKKLGYGGFYMVNLFAWISSKPTDLLTCADPLGDNDTILDKTYAICNEVIFCWGAFKEAKDRIREVAPRYPNAKCLGFNQDGTPFHPLAMMYKGLTKSPKLRIYDEYATIPNH